MNRCRSCLTGLLAFCLAFILCGVQSLAAQESGPYTYTITFYAGNQGSFTGGGRIQVIDRENRAVTDGIEIRREASAIVLKGLRAGYTVTFQDIQGEAVDVGPDSVYYVRGLRRSGYDNDTVAQPAFRVEQDQDYVVAYGIQGDLVSYVVNYQDAAGNTLIPSRTYRGNAGDRPMAAFAYIEGYEPQAYNLTRTLSVNEAENVFTFVYSPVESTGGGGGAGTGTAGAGATGGAAGTAGAGTPGGAAGTGTAGAPGGAGVAGAAAVPGGAGTADGGAGAAGAGAADGEAGAVVPDGETPAAEGPEDVRNLDDEDTPLADFPVDESTAQAGMMFGLPVIASVCLILAAAAAAAAGLRYRAAVKRQGKEDEE